MSLMPCGCALVIQDGDGTHALFHYKITSMISMIFYMALYWVCKLPVLQLDFVPYGQNVVRVVHSHPISL